MLALAARALNDYGVYYETINTEKSLNTDYDKATGFDRDANIDSDTTKPIREFMTDEEYLDYENEKKKVTALIDYCGYS